MLDSDFMALAEGAVETVEARWGRKAAWVVAATCVALPVVALVCVVTFYR